MDHLDRSVLERDRARNRNKPSVRAPDQRQFIGQQPPAAVDQGRAERALARSRQSGEDESLSVAVHNGRMKDEKLMCVLVDAAVEAPFEKRQSQWAVEGQKGHVAVNNELGLRGENVSPTRGRADGDVIIDETLRREGKVAVE